MRSHESRVQLRSRSPPWRRRRRREPGSTDPATVPRTRRHHHVGSHPLGQPPLRARVDQSVGDHRPHRRPPTPRRHVRRRAWRTTRPTPAVATASSAAATDPTARAASASSSSTGTQGRAACRKGGDDAVQLSARRIALASPRRNSTRCPVRSPSRTASTRDRYSYCLLPRLTRVVFTNTPLIMADRRVQVVDMLPLQSGAKQVGVETKTQVTASPPRPHPPIRSNSGLVRKRRSGHCGSRYRERG